MPNFIKRIEKFSDNHLHKDEQVLSAAFLQQHGSLTKATARASFGLIGLLVNHLFTKGDKQKKESSATPLTKKLPEGTMIMAVTNQRILVYKHKELGASIEAFVTEYKLGDIVKIDLKSRMIMTVVTIHFKDGGSVMLEATMLQKLNDFAKLACNHK